MKDKRIHSNTGALLEELKGGSQQSLRCENLSLIFATLALLLPLVDTYWLTNGSRPLSPLNIPIWLCVSPNKRPQAPLVCLSWQLSPAGPSSFPIHFHLPLSPLSGPSLLLFSPDWQASTRWSWQAVALTSSADTQAFLLERPVWWFGLDNTAFQIHLFVCFY